ISNGVATELSDREIARRIGRHHSCVSREISGNGGRERYSAADSHERATALRARPKRRKLESCRRLHDAVNDGLRQKWSPEQISKRLGGLCKTLFEEVKSDRGTE
ncbi:MAG: transposase, partial [Terriglobia bacterium]